MLQTGQTKEKSISLRGKTRMVSNEWGKTKAKRKGKTLNKRNLFPSHNFFLSFGPIKRFASKIKQLVESSIVRGLRSNFSVFVLEIQLKKCTERVTE